MLFSSRLLLSQDFVCYFSLLNSSGWDILVQLNSEIACIVLQYSQQNVLPLSLLQKILSNGLNPFKAFFFFMYNKVNTD